MNTQRKNGFQCSHKIFFERHVHPYERHVFCIMPINELKNLQDVVGLESLVDHLIDLVGTYSIGNIDCD